METKPGTPKTMNDGTEAYLTGSGNYYCRREPEVDSFNKIEYYTLEGEYIPLAKGKCKECNDIIQSQMCGSFQTCSCKKSFVDTDRWTPERHRYGGEVERLVGNE